MHTGILSIRLDIRRMGHRLPYERVRRIAAGLICAATFALKAAALCLSAMLASASGYKYAMMILVTNFMTILAPTLVFLGVNAMIAMIAIHTAILRNGAID